MRLTEESTRNRSTLGAESDLRPFLLSLRLMQVIAHILMECALLYAAIALLVSNHKEMKENK